MMKPFKYFVLYGCFAIVLELVLRIISIHLYGANIIYQAPLNITIYLYPLFILLIIHVGLCTILKFGGAFKKQMSKTSAVALLTALLYAGITVYNEAMIYASAQKFLLPSLDINLMFDIGVAFVSALIVVMLTFRRK